MSDLFPGDARAAPDAPSSRGVLRFGSSFRSGERIPPGPVRHARGYEPFVAFVEAAGADPAVLAADLGALASSSGPARTR